MRTEIEKSSEPKFGTVKNVVKKYENLGNKSKKKIKYFISRIFIYFVLTEMAFLFILPFLYIFTTSLKTPQDYLDPTVQWIPTQIDWNNFVKAFNALHYWRGFANTMIISIACTVGQLFSCAIAGYGLGRYKYKGRNVIFVLVVLALLIPMQTIILPSYGIYSDLGLIDTYVPLILPAFLGQGIRGALFVLIFMYFFQRIPDALDDAARIDGAGPIRLFTQIMLPLVKSAIIVVGIFSFVWHWNDNYESSLYLTNDTIRTLQPKLQSFYTSFQQQGGNLGNDAANLSEPTLFAGCLFVMLPVLIVYILGQKQLAAGIERLGVIE
ncbi:MAG: carbohydrate ABC transporter permease [Clostridiales bacterium]|nr:carbohydrate ABC transporter permease [Clostridiales bacterium]